MTHDPLCKGDEVGYACMCPLIARVRADEQAKYAFIELAKTDDRSTVISLPRGGEHVDWCRDLACYGCVEVTE